MKRLTLLLCALLMCLSACGSQESDALASLAPGEEHRLTVYTSHKEEVYGPIVKEFEERTGIWVTVVTGGTNELLERIHSEGDRPECDVMFGGGVESLMQYETDFEPYTCSEADQIQPGLRPAGDAWAPFSSLPVVLIYNTRLVSEDQLTGWADLLDPRWKGKIAFADPSVSGSGYTAVMAMLVALGGDEADLLEQFADNLDGKILMDSGDVVGAVSSGECSVGITLEETAVKRRSQGASIGIVYPVEGTSNLPDGTALIANAPHRDNAVAFLEFVQSADVQELVVSDFSRRTVRIDVADMDFLPPMSQVSLVDYPIEQAAAEKERFLQLWRELNREKTP